ncbi:MAG: hypothetical protein DIU75_016375 [Mycolicibacterium hassiacum]
MKSKRSAQPQPADKWDRLRARQRPTTTYRIVVDPDGLPAAQQAFAAAVRERDRVKATAVGRGRAAALRRAEQAVAEAQARLDACYADIVLQALRPADLEALVAAHPPTAEQMEAARKQSRERGTDPEWPAWNDDTFRPALIAACAVDPQRSAEEWAEFMAECLSEGEQTGLWRACLEVNHRERIADPWFLPKGLMQILSLSSNSRFVPGT